MDFLSLVLWAFGALLVVIVLGAAFLLWRKQRERARRNQVAHHFGVTIPHSVVVAPTKGAHPARRVEYRLPHYASGEGNTASEILIPAISTLIVEQWMFSSVYPTHISDLAWHLRSRGYDIPLSPEETAKAAQADLNGSQADPSNPRSAQPGRCELADFAALLPADLASRIDPDSGVSYL